MLERLFISKVRVRILRVFLETKTSQPPVEHHVRALVRLLDEEINAIRRELKNLEAAEILESEQSGNKIIYRLNPRNPILPDLRQMLLKDSSIAQSLISGIKHFPEVSMAILTHHYIDQLYSNESDLDLLLIGKADVTSLNNIISQIERENSRQIRVSMIPQEDFEFRKKKRDPFLTNIIYNEHVIILGSERNLALN